MNRLQETALKFGIIGFVLYMIVFIGIYLIDLNPYSEIVFVDFFLIPILVLFGMLEFRSVNSSVLEYKQGMSVGVLIVLVLAFLSTGFIALYHYAIDSSLFNDYLQENLVLLEENKGKIMEEMGKETYDTSYAELENMSVVSLCFDNFWKKSIIGLLLTVMISIILRKSAK